jgi:serine-type D-Ala-D-Ala carboxypeptidase/endopeptidase
MNFSIRITLIALLCGASAAFAGLTKEMVDSQVRSLVDADYCAGVVVGVHDETGDHFYSYGATNKQGGHEPDADTIFEVGSVSKVLTATVLAQMVQNKQLELSQGAAALLPADWRMPRDICLFHLAAHTSGLPLVPANLRVMRPENPYGDYTEAQLKLFLDSFVPPRSPGDRYEYSQVGYAILGQVLARKAGKSYEQMVIDSVCAPLEMKDTRIQFDDAARKRLPQGYNLDGEAVGSWDAPVFYPAVGFHSTAKDMLKFAAANAGAVKTPFDVALKSMTEQQAEADRNNDMGLGWQLARKFNVVWHNGETGGFHSFVAALPRQKAAVVLLSNTASPMVDVAGIGLAKILLGYSVGTLSMRVPVKIEPSVLDDLVGEYRFSPTQSLRVIREGDALYVQASGQSRLRVYGESATKFFAKALDAQIEFDRSPEGKVDSLTFIQNNRRVPAQRVK